MGNWSQYQGDGSLRFSWHTILPFIECPQYYKYSMVDDLVPREYQRGISLGSCVHDALAEYYQALRLDSDDFKSAESKALASIEANADVMEEDRDTAHRVLIHYFQHYYPAEVPDKIKILDVERDIESDFRHYLTGWRKKSSRILYHAKLDAIIEILSGDYKGVWALEHKTASAMTASTFVSYRMDGQILGEVASLQATGYPNVRGVLLNLMTTAQSPKFERAYIQPDQYEITNFANSISYWERVIRQKRSQDGPWPRNYGRCVGRYGLCAYRDLCTYGDSKRSLYAIRSELKPGDLIPEPMGLVWNGKAYATEELPKGTLKYKK